MNIYLEIHRDDNELKLAFPYAVLKQEKNVMPGGYWILTCQCSSLFLSLRMARVGWP